MLLSSLLGRDSEEEEENQDNNISPQPEINPDEGRRLRNLISFDDEMKNNLIIRNGQIIRQKCMPKILCLTEPNR